MQRLQVDDIDAIFATQMGGIDPAIVILAEVDRDLDIDFGELLGEPRGIHPGLFRRIATCVDDELATFGTGGIIKIEERVRRSSVPPSGLETPSATRLRQQDLPHSWHDARAHPNVSSALKNRFKVCPKQPDRAQVADDDAADRCREETPC